MRSVVVAGWIGSTNLGDELVFSSLKAKLMARDLEVVALSTDPMRTMADHAVRATSVRNVTSTARVLRRASAVVVGGGGLLQDETSPFNLPYHLARPVLARRLGVRAIGGIGLGVGPIDTRAGRWLVRHGLRGVAPITVRDEASRQLLERFGVSARTTADLVFGLPVPAPGEGGDLVVCLRPWSAARRVLPVGARPSHEIDDWFVERMATALDAASASSGLAVRFVALHADRDHPVHERVAAAMRAPATLARPGLGDLIDEIAAGAAVVSMRYHGIVAATLAGRPSVAIGYSPKVDALANELGDAGWLVPWTRDGIDVIPHALRAVIGRGDAAVEARDRLRERERGNDDALDELLARSS